MCARRPRPRQVPLPYPNFAISILHIHRGVSVIIGGSLTESLVTQGTISQGDDTGLLGGVVSSTRAWGPTATSWAVSRSVLAACSTRLTSVTTANGVIGNMIGMSITPSQVCVLVLG